MSPWLVEQFTNRLRTRLPLGIRLAMRDTARFPSRTGLALVCEVPRCI